MIPVDRLRWKIGNKDVTCINCHTAIYRPAEDEDWCPTCRAAAGEDVSEIQSELQNKAKALRVA